MKSAKKTFKRFGRTLKTHLQSAIHHNYMVCGVKFDRRTVAKDVDGSEILEVVGPVTCPDCAREILNCRGVHVPARIEVKE